MALELFGGAAVGAVFGEFLRAVLEAKQNAEIFRSKLEDLEATLGILHPVIEDIDELNRQLNRSVDCERETETIRKLMEDGKKLVSKCSKIGRWNLPKKSRYQQKLTQLDNSLLRFHSLHMQAHMARDVKFSLLALSKVCLKLNLPPQCFNLRASRMTRSNQEKFRIAVLVSAVLQYTMGLDRPGFTVVMEDRVDMVKRYSEGYDKFNNQNTLRISEYETKENESCDEVIPTHNAELNAPSPAIIVLMLLCCFNLVMTLLIFMFK